jgi:transketolase
VWEAALSAAHHRLDRLVAIVDRNGYQLDGAVDDVVGVEPLADKWRAFGWRVVEVDGHDVAAVRDTLAAARDRETDGIPTCVIALTSKGKGVSYMETEPGWHLGYLDPEDARRALQEIEGAGA